jgi:mono/diheme cytochrome c family protein
MSLSSLRTLCLVLLVQACGSPPAPPVHAAGPNPMLAEVGREEFVRYCASCHGLDARGGGPAATSLRTPPADLTRIAARRGGDFPADEVAAWIDGRLVPGAHGTREMPVWGVRFSEGLPPEPLTQDLVRGRIVVLVEYLESIQGK